MANRSGLRFKIQVFYADGKDQTITTAPIDAVVWEKNHAGQPFPADMDVSRILWIAWNAGRRKKEITESTFEAWVATLDDFERITEDDDEEGPTSPDPLGSESSDSPSEPDSSPLAG